MSERFDVLVVGGGPAGSAASISLQRMGYATCLVDSGGEGFKAGESLPPAVRLLLDELGAGSAVAPEVARISYGNQSAWGTSELIDTDFIRNPQGCGWHVDRRRFDSVLRDVAALSGADVRVGVRVHEAKARWVVDCSGRAASIARSKGARRTVYDKLMAVGAVFEGRGEDKESRTLVESAADGWWYTSLVPGARRIVAFHTDAGNHQLVTARRSDEFLRMMRATLHVREQLERDGYRMLGVPRIAAANTAMLDRFSAPGWIAAGDAAIALDPLASQGILTALYSGVQAARTIRRIDQGDLDAGMGYERDLNNVFTAYRRNRDPFYQVERRWLDRSFWKSRQGPA